MFSLIRTLYSQVVYARCTVICASKHAKLVLGEAFVRQVREVVSGHLLEHDVVRSTYHCLEPQDVITCWQIVDVTDERHIVTGVRVRLGHFQRDLHSISGNVVIAQYTYRIRKSIVRKRFFLLPSEE